MDIKKIAKERIKILIKLAFEYAKKDLELSRKYIELARKIGKRANVRLRKLKRLFCKNCNTPLIFGYTARVRLNKKNKTINITVFFAIKRKDIHTIQKSRYIFTFEEIIELLSLGALFLLVGGLLFESEF